MSQLSEITERKFIETFDVDDWEIETDSGWQDIYSVSKTVEYNRWIIKTESVELKAADTHILFDENYNEIYLKDCIPLKTKIITKAGPQLVTEVQQTSISENMYDISVNSKDHRFYSNGILSHNSTAVIGYLLWYVLFNPYKTAMILANKGDTAQEILGKAQLAYLHLPKFIQQGIVDWNKRSFTLENGSRAIAEATSSASVRGYSVNFLILDEAAHIEHWEEFSTSTLPVISSGQTTKLAMISTPNGLNHFWAYWESSKLINIPEDKWPKGVKWNGYLPLLVKWTEVPGRDKKWYDEVLAEMNFNLQKFAQEYECVTGDTLIKLRDKITNQIFECSIEKAFEMLEFINIT